MGKSTMVSQLMYSLHLAQNLGFAKCWIWEMNKPNMEEYVSVVHVPQRILQGSVTEEIPQLLTTDLSHCRQ